MFWRWYAKCEKCSWIVLGLFKSATVFSLEFFPAIKKGVCFGGLWFALRRWGLIDINVIRLGKTDLFLLKAWFWESGRKEKKINFPFFKRLFLFWHLWKMLNSTQLIILLCLSQSIGCFSILTVSDSKNYNRILISFVFPLFLSNGNYSFVLLYSDGFSPNTQYLLNHSSLQSIYYRSYDGIL